MNLVYGKRGACKQDLMRPERKPTTVHADEQRFAPRAIQTVLPLPIGLEGLLSVPGRPIWEDPRYIIVRAPSADPVDLPAGANASVAERPGRPTPVVAIHETAAGASSRSPEHGIAAFLPFIPVATRYAARKVSANEVDDIVHDSLLRILAARPGANIEHPKAYFMMVVKAVIVDHLRHDASTRRKDHCELTDCHHPVDSLNPCRIMMGRQELERFTARLNELPTRSREMLLAVRIEGLSLKAAADRFGVCVSTVEKQISRALARLSEVP